ncbi:hypothetical protein QJQ45_020540 [Haematococcus lacustris]|nr:hypothetical protein QJQ45_020540 [Haematococcus lacustris]
MVYAKHKSAVALVVASIACVSAYYVPGTYPQEFRVGAVLNDADHLGACVCGAAHVNSLTSFDTELPYDYYSLPFCKPPEGLCRLSSCVEQGNSRVGDVRIKDPGTHLHCCFPQASTKSEDCCSGLSELRLYPHVSLMKSNASSPLQPGPRSLGVQLDNALCRQVGMQVLKQKIDKHYRINMALDNLPVTVYDLLDEDQEYVRPGFELGYKEGGKYYINNHLVFNILVYMTHGEYTAAQAHPSLMDGIDTRRARKLSSLLHSASSSSPASLQAQLDTLPRSHLAQRRRLQDTPAAAAGGDDGTPTAQPGADEPYYMVVGFEVSPCSIARKAGEPLEDIICGLGDDSHVAPQEVVEGARIVYSYDVYWLDSRIKWTSRWDAYLRMPGGKVHWFSIATSLLVVLVMAVIVALILVRTVRRDLAKYEQLVIEGGNMDAREESGWKLVTGDVFRAPLKSKTLAVQVGSGVQILSTSAVSMLLASLGFLSPAARGALLTTTMVLYVLLALLAGAAAVYCWGAMERSYNGWHSVCGMVAVYYPGIIMGIFTLLNLAIHSTGKPAPGGVAAGSLGAVPVGMYFGIVAVWFLVSIPLTFVGGYLALRLPIRDNPVKTNQIPRHVPPPPLAAHPTLLLFAAGILPFGTMFIELYFAMTSLWLGYFYYLFGFVFLIGALTLVINAEISVLCTYVQLCAEDYQWWSCRVLSTTWHQVLVACCCRWSSFRRGGSVAIYFAIYALGFLLSTLATLDGFLPVLIYVCYMTIAVTSTYFAMGMVGDWLQLRANQEVLNVTQAQLLAQSWGSNFLSCIGNTSFVPLRTYRLYIWRDRLPIAAILEQSSASFYNVTGILVAITMFANQADMIKEVIFQAEQGTRTFDMLLLDPVNFVTLASMGALQDLTALVTADNTLQWEDVHMLYRRDVVARLNVSLPHTYEELLEFATRVNGTPYWDAATNQTQRLWGLCSSSGFAEAFDLGDVFASGVQYKGASQGMVYDPATMTPLANSSAMIRALSLWQRLIRYHKKSLSTLALLQGPCALTIELAFKAKLMALRTSPFAGNVGSLPLPGSEQVLDRATNTMQPCTPQLCPYAQAVAGPANSTRYINRAPYTGPLGYLLAARKGLSSQDLQAVYQFMAYTMAPSVQAQQNLQPSSFFVPMRSSQLDVSQVSTWEAAGYHPQDIEGLLATIRFQNDNGNVGSHLRLSTAHVLASLVNATVNLTAGQRPELVAQALQAAWAPDSQPGYTLDSLRNSYWRLINFAPSTPLKEVAWELEIEHMKEALGLGIGLGLGCMLLLVLGLLLVAKLRAAQHKSMLGKLLPPLAGPHTTLIVTDIQDSTKLWEQFSAEVMDTALALHNAVMTSQAAVWKGYESAYEGDSYTIAFHTAQSAVQFALAVQKALLTVNWPLQLLEQAELCRPFIVLPAAASSQLPAFHPAALAAGSSTYASMPLAMRLNLASRPEQPTVASYLRRLRPSQDMYFKRSTQSLELGPKNEPQQPSSATALPNQAAQHTLYASPTALVSPATLKPAMVSAPSTGCRLSGPSGQAGQAGDACTSNYLSASTNTTLDEADLFSAAEAFLTSNSRGQYDGTSPAAWGMQPSGLLKGWPGSNGISESGHGAYCDAAPLTLHQHLLRSTAVVPSGTAGSLLLFRGLRVRMGMHTGVHDPSDVARDAGTGRQRYSGAILAAAKAVQDCAQGGQVLISEATFAEARHMRHLAGSTSPCVLMLQLGSLALREDLVVMHAGQHVLKEGKAPEDIFNCFSRSLILRIAFLGPVRSVTETVSGCLAAPCEQATITFMNVVSAPCHVPWAGMTRLGAAGSGPLSCWGLPGLVWWPGLVATNKQRATPPARLQVGTATLMAWDARVCRKALRVYFDLGRSLLACSDTAGYLVEVTEGLLLVAALRPSCAIRWALSLMRSCLAADWPEELLAHELGEQVAMNIPVATQPANRKRGPQGSHQLAKLTRSVAESQSRSVGAVQTQLLVLMRGLRLKCGIDVGSVKSSVSSLSARMEFRGKVMNRAARISALATTCQVWVSDAAWQQAQPDINLHKVLVEGGSTPSPTYQPHTPAPAPPPGLGYSWTARAAPEPIIAVDVGQHQLKGIQRIHPYF